MSRWFTPLKERKNIPFAPSAFLTLYPDKPLLPKAENDRYASSGGTPGPDNDNRSRTYNTDPEAQDLTRYRTFPPSPSPSGSVGSADSAPRSRINPRIVSDAILGLSDGLTVPFALSAGLSALGNTKVVVMGSLAELVAGAISMGLGGYVGAKSEA